MEYKLFEEFVFHNSPQSLVLYHIFLKIVRETGRNVSDFYFKSVTENKKISGFRDIIEVCI